MKDGDAQQQNEILRSIEGIFPNAIEGGCGWHIGKYSNVNKHFFLQLIKIINYL